MKKDQSSRNGWNGQNLIAHIDDKIPFLRFYVHRSEAYVANDIFSIDGHAFRSAEEQESYLRFIREEGLPLLKAFGDIQDTKIRSSLVDLIKRCAKHVAKKN